MARLGVAAALFTQRSSALIDASGVIGAVLGSRPNVVEQALASQATAAGAHRELRLGGASRGLLLGGTHAPLDEPKLPVRRPSSRPVARTALDDVVGLTTTF
jgi:hypothetical protein